MIYLNASIAPSSRIKSRDDVQECWEAFINAWRSNRFVSSWLDGASPGVAAEEFGAAENFDGPASAAIPAGNPLCKIDTVTFSLLACCFAVLPAACCCCCVCVANCV